MSSRRQDQMGKISTALMMLVAFGFILLATTYVNNPVAGQYEPPFDIPPPPPPPPPPPIIEIPPPPPPPPIIPPPPLDGTPPILVPTDITNANLMGLVNPTNLGAVSGPIGATSLKALKEDKSGPTDGLYYRPKTGTEFTHPNNFEIALTSGEILVSVRHPSHNMVVTNPLGTVSGLADSDAIVSYKNGVLHVFNLNTQKGAVQIKLDKGHFGGAADPVLQLSAGYELVAADRKLSRSDVRPPDGVGRKNTRLVEDGYVAISQFAPESLLNNSEILADMNQQAAGTKEKRIINDLSKMAAVLNVVNGSGGFEATSKSR